MQTINTDTFNNLKAMMSEIMPELVAVFFEDTQKLLLEIQSGIKEQDRDKILTAVHTLKSSAKNMGADKLTAYSFEIESVLNDGEDADSLKVKSHYQDIKQEMTKVKQDLESLIALNSTTSHS